MRTKGVTKLQAEHRAMPASDLSIYDLMSERYGLDRLKPRPSNKRRPPALRAQTREFYEKLQ